MRVLDAYHNNLDDGRGARPLRLERLLATAVVLLLVLGSLAIMLPFVSALAWAFVMSFSLWPIYHRLVARFGGRRTLAALTMTVAIVMVVVVPTTIAVVNLSDDASALAATTKQWVAGGPPPAPQWLRKVPLAGPRAAVYWDALAGEVNTLLRKAQAGTGQGHDVAPGAAGAAATTAPAPHGVEAQSAAVLAGVLSWAGGWLRVAGVAIVQGSAHVLLSVFLTFFIFRDGAALGGRVTIAIRRIGGDGALRLLDVAASTVRGVVYGILGTALIQGALAGIGFLVAGVPGAALLGLATFFLSVVPLGPPLVWAPAAAWLFHTGHAGWGTFMLLWGLAVSSIDNVVKPLIISKGSATPFILILFGVIGGALTFGFIGVFLGPTLLAVCYRMLEEWSREAAPAPVPLNAALTPS